jgi:hypothetical protein
MAGRLVRRAAGALLAAAAGCGGEAATDRFVDRLPGSGVDFVHENGASGAKLLPEINGGCVAVLDHDGDGRRDLLFGQGAPLPGADPGRDWRDRLYRNLGGWRFVDVTDAAGVAGAPEHICAGGFFVDANRDGLLDLYVYCTTMSTPPYPDDRARNRLHLNLGDGTFEDVSIASATDSDRTSNAAAAFDPGTGDLVLYVANDAFCYDDLPVLPEPELAGDDAWYRLDAIDASGVPSFVDEAESLGLHACRSSMGVSFADVDRDLDPDFYITDIGANDLFVQPIAGEPQPADRGIDDRADDDGHILVGWGARFVDLDRDGSYELYVVNGATQTPTTCEGFHQLDGFYREPSPGATFDRITERVGLPGTPSDCETPVAPALTGRGLASGDLDGDGDDDFVVAPWIEAYRFQRTDVDRPGKSLRVRLRGTVSSPDPIGAAVIVTRLDGTQVAAFRTAGGDPGCQSDATMTFGVGDDDAVLAAAVRWPSGIEQTIEPLPEIGVNPAVTVVTEPAWLTVEPRVVTATDPPPELVLQATPGQTVTIERSDGWPVVVTENAGVYSAQLFHPGAARRTTVTVLLDGVPLRPRPMITYR